MDEDSSLQNYSEEYRQSLYNLVKDAKVQGKKTLKSLVESKSKEYDLLSYFAPDNISYINILSILRLSLYFIEGDNFIKEDYFSINEQKIYKAFNELLKTPTEEQSKKFFNTFENLDLRADIIYLICKFFYSDVPFLAVNLYFRIVLEKHFDSVKDIFQFEINPDRKELLLKLSSFYKIKYNPKEVTHSEIINLFVANEDNKSGSNIDKMSEQNIIKKESDSHIILNETNIPDINTKEENSIKNSEDKLKNIEDIPKENLDTSFIIKDSSSTVNLNKKNEIIQYEKFLIHLNEKKKFYESLKYDTPVLKYLIEKKGAIKIDYLKYKKEEKNFIDHLFDNMENFLLKLSLNCIDFKDGKCGYCCYKINNKYVEGLYNIVDLHLLKEKITSDINFPKDDFMNPDSNIARNAFKSRTLSLEYYINNNFLLNELKVKERFRVIYCFNSIDEIMKIEESKEINYMYIDNEENKDKEIGIIEVDGVILENVEIKIDLNERIFIQDKCYNFGVFINPDDGKKAIDNFFDDEKLQNLYNFILKPHTLCIIEIKNQFLLNEEIAKNKYINNQGISFHSMIRGLIRKALVIKTIYEQLEYKFNKIKLILFYDAIHKYNYEEELKLAFNEELDLNDKELIEKIQFQCIYIKSSYLSGTISIMNNDLEMLKSENKNIRKELEETKKTVVELLKKIDKIEKKNGNDSNKKNNNDINTTEKK